MPFDHTKLSIYTVPQLIEFIKNGEVTFEELQQLGLPYYKQEEIRKFLAEQEEWEVAKTTEKGIADYLANHPNGYFVDEANVARAALKEDAVWSWACDGGTVQAYEMYLEDYPSGKHVTEAEMNIKLLRKAELKLKEDLFEDMKANPWNYTHDKMRNLYNGVTNLTQDQIAFLKGENDIYSQFVLKGMRITHQELIEHGVVPECVTQRDVITPEFTIAQTNIDRLGEYPKDRTDVFFLGVPRSGKSSVLSGMLYQLWKQGSSGYIPQLVNGIDPCVEYYDGLRDAVAMKKPPVPTATDTISFMKINFVIGSEISKVTIVEMAGEAFRRAAKKIKGETFGNVSESGVWKELGAEKCLRSNNKKVLFFVLDYAATQGINPMCTAQEQLSVLESALRTFCYDGPDPANPRKGCTMSKVLSVTILITKSDLMGKELTPNERNQEAVRYMEENFKNFMRTLVDESKNFGCNKATKFMPHILTFSLGDFYVGNTYVFDPTDSIRLINHIHRITPTETTKLFGLF